MTTIFDPTVLRSACGGDPKLLRKVVASLLRETPARLEAIRSALVSGDARQVAWEAHALTGVFQTIGAKALAESCRALTVLSKGDDVTGLESLFRPLVDGWRSLQDDLTRILPEHDRDAPDLPARPSVMLESLTRRPLPTTEP